MPNQEAVNFIIKARDEATAELKKLGVSFQDVGHKASEGKKEASEGLKGISEGAKLAQEGIEAFLGVMASTEIVNQAIDAYSKYEQALFDIGRSTGVTGKQLKEFGDSFEDATKEATQLTPELLKVADILLRSGVSMDNVGVSTQRFADIASITRISVSDLTTHMTRLVAVMGETPDKAIAAAEAFALVSAKTRGGSQEFLRIEDILGRELGATFKLTTSQVQALAASLSDLGGGRGGTIGANILVREMTAMKTAAEEGGTKLQIFANAMAMSSKQAKEFIENNPDEAVLKLNDSMGRASGSTDAWNKTLKQVGLTYTELQRGGLLTPSALKSHAEYIKEITDNWVNHNKVTEQVTIYNNLYKNSVDALAKAFDNVNKELGETLAPGFEKFNNALKQGIDDVKYWYKSLGDTQKLIVADIIAYTPAVLGLAAGFKLLSAGIKLAIGDLLLFLATPVGATIGLVTVGVIAGYEAWKNWASIVDTIRDKNSDWHWLEPAIDGITKLNAALSNLQYSNTTLVGIKPPSAGVDKAGSSTYEQVEGYRRYQAWIQAHPEMALGAGEKGTNQTTKEWTGFGGDKMTAVGGTYVPSSMMTGGATVPSGGKPSPYAEDFTKLQAQITASKEMQKNIENLTGAEKEQADAEAKLREKYPDDAAKVAALSEKTKELAAENYNLKISQQSVNAAMSDFFDNYTRTATNWGKNATSVMQTTMNSIDTLVMESLGRQKLNWRQFAQSILSEVMKLWAIHPIMAAIMGTTTENKGGGPPTMGPGLGGVATAIFSGGANLPNFPNLFPAGALSGGLTGQAKGGTFSSDSLSRASNSIVDQPFFFKFAQGGSIGVAGEAGSEAIMPLKRDSSGNLGVSSMGTGGMHYNPEMHFHIGDSGSSSSKMASPDSGRAMESFGKMVDDKVRSTVTTTILNEMRPGGMLAGSGRL